MVLTLACSSASRLDASLIHEVTSIKDLSPLGYQSQLPVIEQAIDTAARMLGTDKSRGYCLEMICADFLAGAHLDNGDPEILLNSISRYYKFLPKEQRQAFLENLREKAC